MSKQEVIQVEGILDLSYIYTAGHLGQEFAKGLSQAKLRGAICELCGAVYIPVKGFCEECFTELHDLVEVGPGGTIHTMTYVDGEWVGAIQLDGASSLLIHRLIPGSFDPQIGDEVEAVFKPKQQRKGSINDLKGFRVLG